jgi:hypothetical protein
MPHRIYEWKHGWIPLTHRAALSKAKGREPAARRYLASSHAAGVTHHSVVAGTYGGGTHIRGTHPVAAEHLPRADHITAAHNPAALAFAVLDRRTGNNTAIPEHLAEHFHTQGHTITAVGPGGHTITVDHARGGARTFAADGTDRHTVDPAGPAPNFRGMTDDQLAGHLGTATDNTEIDSIIRELDRRDGLAKRRQQAEARRQRRQATLDAEYDKRVDAGDDPEQAFADLYGVSVERQRRQQAIAALRDGGYQGAGFDQLARAAYQDHLDTVIADAEAATNGYFWKGPRTGTKPPRPLFTGTEAFARANASDELLDYWQAHGRITFNDYKASLLGGRLHSKEVAAWH